MARKVLRVRDSIHGSRVMVTAHQLMLKHAPALPLHDLQLPVDYIHYISKSGKT